MNPKQKKCKNCKEMFKPMNSLQCVCSQACAIVLSKPIVRKQQEVKWKEEKKVLKEKSRDFKKELQDEMNKIARLIDYGNVCMSCQRYPKKTFGAHFRSVGGHSSIRYNLNNIYLGCFSCNGKKGGNVHGYDSGLQNTFGKDWWEYLKNGLLQDYSYLGLKKEDYPPLIKEARKIARELEKDLKVRTPDERLKKRTEYNERLGIYKTKPI